MLPEASCSKCATTTGQFEQICLRGNFDTYRRHFNLRSKRRELRHDLIPLDVQMPDGTIEHRRVRLEDYPRCLTLPEMLEPGILTGYMTAPLVGRWHWHSDSPSALAEIERRLGGKPLVNQTVDFIAFAKLLAKIGHGWACAHIGVENFFSFLPSFILGKDLSIAGSVVGTSKVIASGKQNDLLHALDIILINRGNTVLILIEVHLFSNSTPFRYGVVAGVLTPKTDAGWNWVEINVTSERDRAALKARFNGPAHVVTPEPRIDDPIFLRLP